MIFVLIVTVKVSYQIYTPLAPRMIDIWFGVGQIHIGLPVGNQYLAIARLLLIKVHKVHSAGLFGCFIVDGVLYYTTFLNHITWNTTLGHVR